jgi:hypothetical protein
MSATNTAVAVQISQRGLSSKQMLSSASGTLKANAAALGGVRPGESRGGFQFVSMNGNTGVLGFGRDSKGIPSDQQFAIPADGMKQGWTFWEKGRPEEETRVFVSAFQKFPEKPDDRPMSGEIKVKGRERDGWARVYQLSMVGIEAGPLKDLNFVWEQSSKGFTDLWADIAMAIADNYEKRNGESELLHPVVTFSIRSYEHKVYDKTIYTPQFELLGWTDGIAVEYLSNTGSGAAPAPETGEAGDALWD